MRAIFLADGNIFTTGFSRMSERQLALWNPVGSCPLPAWPLSGPAQRCSRPLGSWSGSLLPLLPAPAPEGAAVI